MIFEEPRKACGNPACWFSTSTGSAVLRVASHDGDLDLDTGFGPAVAAQDVKHGTEPHSWMFYPKAAE